MDAYRGTLSIERNRHGLEATVSVDTRSLHIITTDGAWVWPLGDVAVRRWDGNEFKLNLADDEFLFEPDDPISFTFDVVDRLGQRPSRRIRRHNRTQRSTDQPTPRPVRSQPDAPADESARSEIWTDLATGREEAHLLAALSELNRQGEHAHRLAPGDWHADGAVQVCVECRQVFIDLSRAEDTVAADPGPNSHDVARNAYERRRSHALFGGG